MLLARKEEPVLVPDMVEVEKKLIPDIDLDRKIPGNSCTDPDNRDIGLGQLEFRDPLYS